MIRETYYVALFALLSSLKTAGVVKVCDRRLRLLKDMADGELPALFMTVDNQHTAQKKGFPAKHSLDAKVFLYAANPSDQHTADIVLNGLIDAVEAALAPAPGCGVQTLGGLVEHAWIEGAIEVFAGPLSQRAAAILTITMLVP